MLKSGRHDPASAAVEVMLRGLKMYGMAQAVGELIEQGAPAFDAAVPILSQLLKAEMAEREVRSIAYQIKAARFPAYKDLAGFDFASSEVNEALVRQLHRSVVRALVKRTSPPRSGCRQSSITARRSGSSPRSTWSMRSNRKKPRTRPGNWPNACCVSTFLSSMSSDICRSAHQAGRCCSTCSANFTSAPVLSSPQTSASANGPTCSAMPR
jgi:IstB-like ATP binding protein